jgi:hypothetical protein
MSGPSKKSSPSSGEPENLLVRVGRLHRQAEEFQRTVEEELRTTRALLEELHIREAKRRVMDDEWTKVMSGDRLVKFTYVDLPAGTACLTAQIAGHDVVYSVMMRHTEHPFNREGVERHFDDECPPILN